MEAVKNVVAVLAGLVGLLTALLTLYAKYLDVKKSNARESDGSGTAVEAGQAKAGPDPGLEEEPNGVVLTHVAQTRKPAADIERSRAVVRAPAITLLAAGLVSMFANLFIAGFGYVDQFVTPLTTESKNKRVFMEAARRNELPPSLAARVGADNGPSEDSTVVLTICTLTSLSIASAAAAWAGYSMLRLRSYWLSVAGSFAIMAGAFFCCMAGIPIGVWSLVVLYKPEVAASFR